ncbi:MAG: hypothetical protein KC421_26535 [Anaerolineales bacterium]|nr:hypothetical protein [Anaerolineales bacterium]
MKKIFTKENLIIIVLAPLLVTIVGGIIVVLFENAASTPEPPTPAVFASSDFEFSIRLLQESDARPIPNANIMLRLSGQAYSQNTGLKGNATFVISQQAANRTGRAAIEIDNEAIGEVEVFVSEENSPFELKINLSTGAETPQISTVEPTATATPITTATAVPSTPTLAATNTPVPTTTPRPTDTPVPTATPTIPTPTATAVGDLPDVLVVNLLRTQAVNVYTRPDDVTGAPRANVDGGDLLDVLGQTEDGTWYEVRIQENDIEGWIQAAYVAPYDGTATVQPPTNVTTEPGSGGSAPTTCLSVTISRVSWPNKIYDDVTVIWSNWPDGVHRFRFSAWGTVDGQQVFLVEPTFADTGTPSYEIGLWRFENGGYPSGTTFTYRIEPLDGSGNSLCVTTGTFQ